MFLREADRQRVTSDMRAAAPVQTHRPSYQIRIKTTGRLPESYSNILSKIRQKGLGRQPSESGTDENAKVPNIKGESKAFEPPLHPSLCSSSVLEEKHRHTNWYSGKKKKKQIEKLTAVVGTPQKQGSRVDCHVTCQVKVNCKGYCAF